MSAVVIGKDNPTVDGFATTGLTFNHALSAVKFVAGDDPVSYTHLLLKVMILTVGLPFLLHSLGKRATSMSILWTSPTVPDVLTL